MQGFVDRNPPEYTHTAYLTKERATLGVLTGTLNQGIFNAPAYPTRAQPVRIDVPTQTHRFAQLVSV
jgi:hypothetical protein